MQVKPLVPSWRRLPSRSVTVAVAVIASGAAPSALAIIAAALG